MRLVILEIVISYTGALEFTKLKYTLIFYASNTLRPSQFFIHIFTPKLYNGMINNDEFREKQQEETTVEWLVIKGLILGPNLNVL